MTIFIIAFVWYIVGFFSGLLAFFITEKEVTLAEVIISFFGASLGIFFGLFIIACSDYAFEKVLIGKKHAQK